MCLALILSIGRDPELLESRSSILRADGYIVDSVLSTKQAILHFMDGDFDLVLLCHSIPLKERERLTSSIRAFGSLTPIVSVAPPAGQAPEACAGATIEGAPEVLLSGIQCALLRAKASYPSRNRECAYFY